MNSQLIAAVAVGGALGSVARYLVAIGVGRALGAEFPWGTLIINIVGSFLIGVFVESFALAWTTSQMVRVFLTVGICGGFTTFSTFLTGRHRADAARRAVARRGLHHRVRGAVGPGAVRRPAAGEGGGMIRPVRRLSTSCDMLAREPRTDKVGPEWRPQVQK